MPYILVGLLLSLMLGACSRLDAIHPPAPLPYTEGVAQQQDFPQLSFADVKPLVEKRCTVCHGCYDAPCQLKLESLEGVIRGAHKDKVYNGTRLIGSQLTRLYEDAQSEEQWRNKGFFPVVQPDSIEQSVMAAMLLMKRVHPLPDQALLPDSFDLSLNRDQFCPKPEEFKRFARQHPLWGMPYGLPALSTEEHETLLSWLRGGAVNQPRPPLPDALNREVDKWEAFFNVPTHKGRLVNRYVYEHLYLGQLAIEGFPETYFRLVRSATPPGERIKRISTRRPFDDPGVERVYYRLWVDPASVVAKTHMPYALSDRRMSRWTELFYRDDYSVDLLPGYDEEKSANPFRTFRQLPIESRYRFMLEEAHFTIMNFIKGPVCRGQVALNVIQDHFWIFFQDPARDSLERDKALLAETTEYLSLPAERGNTFEPLGAWLKYSKMQQKYFRKKALNVTESSADGGSLGSDLIWDGDGGRNPNAALTIFRHSDSASVHKGLLGQMPKTAWVIDYPLLERIHYLLVAGFDVYGNVSHQLLTRLYMEFLRMEGELNYVSLMPEEYRMPLLQSWYIGAEKEQDKYLREYIENLQTRSEVSIISGKPHEELLHTLMQQLGNISVAPQHELRVRHRGLQAVHHLQGESVRYLPQNMLILVDEEVYSLVRNNHYSNLSALFEEDERHIEQHDTTTLLRGFIGYYPNTLVSLRGAEEIDAFAASLKQVDSPRNYREFMNRFGVRRTSERFWQVSDQLHELYWRHYPDEAGLLDYNRLENR